MIDVKIIKKPKNKAATPTLRTPGAAYGDKSVKEAVHASKADMAKMAEKAIIAEQAEHAKKADEATRADEVSLEAKTLTHFLRNDIPNTAAEVVTFLKGVISKAVSFFQGIVNKGDINNDGDINNTGNFQNTGDITNSGNIMTKNLTVTGKATFFELEILKAKAAGGIIIQSAGTFKVDDCEETDEGYVCYQLAEKDGKTLSQTCEMGDRMLCHGGLNLDNQPHQPNQANISNHFYWRLVTEAPTTSVRRNINGEEVECLKIVLSKTDFADGSDKPKVGDELAQVGNRDNKERQSVIMTCAYKGLDGDLKTPYWVQYTGVNTYELSKFKRTWFAANGSQVTGNFKVQSDDGGLESIEDYVKGLADEKGKDTVVWQVAFSIRHITDKQGETFRLKVVRIVGDKAEEVDYAAIYAAGADLLVFGDNMGTELRVNPGEDCFTAHYSHSRYLMARVVRYGTDITLAQDTIYTDVEGGKDGKDAVSYKLLPISEIALAYISEDKETKVKTNKVDLKLEYKIQKTIGEQVSFITNLIDEGMTLTIQPSVNKSETFNYDYEIDAYSLSASIKYVEIPDNSYKVTLKKGIDIVDQRIVPIKLKPSVAFDIDTVNGEIRSEIKTVDGNVNSFKATIDETSNTVGNLEKEFTQMKLTSKEISFTVNNGTRPNLLWGSDLNLDGVDITDKAAIEKHLGVVISDDMEIGNREMFQYLKGEGVGGSDAIRFKNAYKREGWAKWTNISWHDVPLKPNTQYTISVWVKFKSYGKRGRMYVDCNSDDGRWNFGGYLHSEHNYSREDIDEWTRVKYVFDSGESRKIKDLFFACIADEEEGAQCELWLCHPKLEEGDKETPWCAYDGTVDALEQTGIFIKDKKIRLNARNTEVSGDLSVGSLQTMPKLVGDPFIEAHDGEFNIFTFERKKGIELSVDDSGMPHLIFYDKDGNPAYDLGWTGMKQLIDANVQEYWSADFLMKEDSYTDATRISNITRDKCKEYYTYHAAYNRKTGFYGSNKEYNEVTFVEKSLGNQRIADGWYYPVNNGSLARVGDESAYVYKTRKFQYSNGKMIGFANVYIEQDPVTGAWRFSDYKGGGGVDHSDHGQI